MSTGLLALLDDVAALAKVAAASLDDTAAQALKVGSKATGIVIDDAAVTPRYVVGLPPERELPIIGKIAFGSLKNKMLFLLPGALALSYLAPWIITPLLMAGGAFLCVEGYHKVHDLVAPHDAHAEAHAARPQTAEELEAERVGSAIRTDFILSAEIMAISLGEVATASFWTQAVLLAVVGLGMTILVYGVVALIVKADDAGVRLAKRDEGPLRALGRAVVAGMPSLLKGLSLVGMAAMLWVGGQILVHGMHGLSESAPEPVAGALAWPEVWIHHVAVDLGHAVPIASGAAEWLVGAGLSGLLGLAVGAGVDLAFRFTVKPLLATLSKPANDHGS